MPARGSGRRCTMPVSSSSATPSRAMLVPERQLCHPPPIACAPASWGETRFTTFGDAGAALRLCQSQCRDGSHQSPCGARTRTGAPCRRTGLGNGRCANHGGESRDRGRQRVERGSPRCSESAGPTGVRKGCSKGVLDHETPLNQPGDGMTELSYRPVAASPRSLVAKGLAEIIGPHVSRPLGHSNGVRIDGVLLDSLVAKGLSEDHRSTGSAAPAFWAQRRSPCRWGASRQPGGQGKC